MEERGTFWGQRAGGIWSLIRLENRLTLAIGPTTIEMISFLRVDSESAMPNELFVTVFNDPLDGRGRVKIRTLLIGGKESIHSFAPPFDLQSLPQHYMQLDDWIIAASNQLIQKGLLHSIATPHERLQQVGAALFDALFPKGSEGRGSYQTKAEELERSKKPLRIRLEIDQAFSVIPWNILWDTLYWRWLAQDHSRTLIQTLTGSVFAKLKRSKQPESLHVVLVTASAAHPSSPEADQRYSKRLQECFEASQHQYSIDFKEITGLNTYGQLEQRIQQDTALHILDIFAHGRIDGSQHILSLTDEAGEIISLPSTWLNGVLRQRRKAIPKHHLFLTVLNNCDSALSVPHSLLAGLAQALVNDGMPMVLGMQSQVSLETVYTVMPVFYRALLSGQTIDQALNSARQALYNNYYSDVDWAVPVLYVSPNLLDLHLLKQPRSKKRSANIAQPVP